VSYNYHIHRNDESGTWSCGGPYTAEGAIKEINRTLEIKKGLGETWRKVANPHGYIGYWSNSNGHSMGIKEG
jgi:hypothetical protein